jgi:hypothetical protein
MRTHLTPRSAVRDHSSPSAPSQTRDQQQQEEERRRTMKFTEVIAFLAMPLTYVESKGKPYGLSRDYAFYIENRRSDGHDLWG